MDLIAVVDTQWGLGREGKLLFRLKPDMQHFKETTLGSVVIMGRKTLQSFPGAKPLPGRDNIVFTRDTSLLPQGVFPCASLGELHTLLAQTFAGRKAFVIGGGEIYRQLLPYCQAAIITHVDAQGNADCFLPDLSQAPEWRLAALAPTQQYEGLRYAFARYENQRPLPLSPLG